MQHLPILVCFQPKETNIRSLAVSGTQRAKVLVWRAAPLGLRCARDSCRVLWGYKSGGGSGQFSLPPCFFTGVEPPLPRLCFHTPPFSPLEKPSDLGFTTSPWVHSFIASYTCQSLDIGYTAVNKCRFEFCPPPRSQPFLSFALGLSVCLCLFLFLCEGSQCFGSIQGLMELSFPPQASSSDSTRQLGV